MVLDVLDLVKKVMLVFLLRRERCSTWKAGDFLLVPAIGERDLVSAIEDSLKRDDGSLPINGFKACSK